MARKGGAPENLRPFKSGHDPRRNLKGRPKTLPDIELLLINVLGEEKDGRTAAEAILQALRLKAVKGDVRAAELILNRGYGKPKESVDLNFKDETKRVVTLPGGTTLEA